ncbi:MAG: hypothetical protein QM496_18235 [Verrucomicrobiota bacterium]
MKEVKQIKQAGPVLTSWLLFYALVYAVFHILPVFLKVEVKSGIRLGDLMDLSTPLVMVFLVYKLYKILSCQAESALPGTSRQGSKIVLILGAVIFVEGHGMHLAANTVNRLIDRSAASKLYELNYFFDEILGHLLWDGGIVILSIGLIAVAFKVKNAAGAKPNLRRLVIASLIYGLTYFINAIEGQTVMLTLPGAVLIPAAILLLANKKRMELTSHACLLFFVVAYGWAVCLFVLWYWWQGAFYQFSDLGWL